MFTRALEPMALDALARCGLSRYSGIRMVSSCFCFLPTAFCLLLSESKTTSVGIVS